MASIVTIQHYGVEGRGKNVTEAKLDAKSKIEKSLRGSYTPTIVEYRGWVRLVYRTPTGWNSVLVSDADKEGNMLIRRGHINGGQHPVRTTEAEVVRGAMLDVAQLGWRFEDGDKIPDLLTAPIIEPSDLVDYRTWVQFQTRYQIAFRKGLNDKDAYDYACKNPGRPELWLLEEKAGAA